MAYLENFDERFKRHQDLLDDIHVTYQQKNTAYGDSFHDTYADLGIIAAATRISDKFNRFKTLAKDRYKSNHIDQGDESITDTLMDMANYCIMTVMEIEREAAKAEENKKENAS